MGFFLNVMAISAIMAQNYLHSWVSVEEDYLIEGLYLRGFSWL